MNEHATPEANQSPPSATEEEEENPIAQSPTQAQEPAQKAVEDYPPGLTKILQSALEQGASHVHLEPHNEDYRLRFRVGGILNEINHYSEKEAGLIIQRLFVQASLESDMRRPQDGIFNFSWKDAKYAIRVSSYPCGRGPKTVLKISKAASLLTFENLGMSAEQVLAVRQLMRRRGGLIIVTGPWSSGKTATMYAIGHEFNKAELNVATIEDPIDSWSQPRSGGPST